MRRPMYYRVISAIDLALLVIAPAVTLVGVVNSGLLLKVFPWLIFWFGARQSPSPGRYLRAGVFGVIVLVALRSRLRYACGPCSPSSNTIEKASDRSPEAGGSQSDREGRGRRSHTRSRAVATAIALSTSSLACAVSLFILGGPIRGHPAQLVSDAVRASSRGYTLNAYESLYAATAGKVSPSKYVAYYFESGWALDLHLRGAASRLSAYLFAAAEREQSLPSMVLAVIQYVEAWSAHPPRGLGPAAVAFNKQASDTTPWSRELSAVLRVAKRPNTLELESLDRTFHAIRRAAPASLQSGLLKAESEIALYLRSLMPVMRQRP